MITKLRRVLIFSLGCFMLLFLAIIEFGCLFFKAQSLPPGRNLRQTSFPDAGAVIFHRSWVKDSSSDVQRQLVRLGECTPEEAADESCDGGLTLSDRHLQFIANDVVGSIDDLASLLVPPKGSVLKEPGSIPAQKIRQKYDLLINSYMNSGSRFTGQMFGFRTGAFYIYEPLWNFHTWNYYHCRDLVCGLGESFDCCKRSATRVNSATVHSRPYTFVKDVQRNTNIVDMMVDVLNDMYNCNFTRLENMFVSDVHDNPKLAGPGWKDYRLCTESKNYTKMQCLRKQEEKCRNSRHVVTKVLRMTTGSYRKLLEKRENLKLLQLYRNPFAIVNSRAETKTYPITSHSVTAAVLCKKMQIDLVGVIELAAKFPGRVRIIFYEDIKSNVTEKVEKLYEFVGMESNIDELKKLDNVSVNEANTKSKTILKTRVKDNSRWWRKHMTFANYTDISNKCGQLVKVFKLTEFRNEAELLNLTVPEMNLPQVFRI